MTADEHLRELLACPGSLAEAVTESESARKALARVIEIIPGCRIAPDTYNQRLVEAANALELAVIEYFIPIAYGFAVKDEEHETMDAMDQRYFGGKHE